MKTAEKKPFFDIKQHVTDRLIEMLEKGQGDLSQMWKKQGLKMPRNALTGIQYTGANVFLLSFSAAMLGYPSNRWMTYKQAASVGAQVRKGEKSTTCIYFTVAEKKSNQEAAGDAKEFYPMCKAFYLFNIAQIDNVPAEFAEPANLPLSSAFVTNLQAQSMIAATGADIRHGGDRAFYNHSTDFIQLPQKEAFLSEANYYATSLHELAHWTGAESRLNRQFGKKFGDEAYAVEELVAEMTAAFLTAELGMFSATVENHAGYLGAWLKILKADKTAIFTASKQASLAYKFIMDMSRGGEAAAQAIAAEEDVANNEGVIA